MRRTISSSLVRILFASFLLASVVRSGAANAENIYIVPSKLDGPHAQVAKGLRTQLSAALTGRFKTRLLALPGNLPLQIKAGQNDYIVTIGSRAFAEALAQNPNVKILATLIPRETYQSLLRAHPRKPGSTSAIYIDQPVQRTLNLVKIALPGKTPGVLIGRNSGALYNQLRVASKEMNLSLYLKQLKPKENLVAALDQVLKNCNVLLAFADPEVSNPSTARHLLLTSYRYGIPVVAYSRAYVRAGALMAVYSTPEQFGKQTAEVLIRSVRGKSSMLPAPQNPGYFSIDINRNVARSLRIELMSRFEIEARLKSIEGAGNE